jgi:hypothetical protein
MRHEIASGGIAALCLLVLAGCNPGDPDGEQGVLFFRGPRDVVQGAEDDILIPRRVELRPRGKFNFDRAEDHDFDFSGTELEVTELDEGLEVLEISLDEAGYRLKIRCGAPEGQRARLAVRIHAGGKARYEDAVQLGCYAPTRILLTPQDAGLRVTGAGVSFTLGAVSEPDGGVTRFLSAGYLQPVDPAQLRAQTEHPRLSDMTGPGRSLWVGLIPSVHPKLASGSFQLALPVSFLADSDWTLQLLERRVEQLSGTGGAYYELEAVGIAADGREVTGLQDCLIRVTDHAGVMQTSAAKECRIFRSTEQGPVTVCAEVRDRQACLTLPGPAPDSGM